MVRALHRYRRGQGSNPGKPEFFNSLKFNTRAKEICQDFFQVITNGKENEIEKRLSLAEEFLCSGALTKQVRSNPFTTKKSSTQRSTIWDKVATTLNSCSCLTFNVDKRSVKDHVGILQNRHKKKLRAEEKATGIVPDEPTELENLLEQIIALEESAEAEQQETGREKNRQIE